MDTTDPDKDVAVSVPEKAPVPAEPGRYVAYAVGAIVLATLAWIVANWNGYVATAVSALAVAAGFRALRSRRHGVRNTAVTAIVAAGVLLVVLVAFIMVIRLGLKSV